SVVVHATAPPRAYTFSLHAALPILGARLRGGRTVRLRSGPRTGRGGARPAGPPYRPAYRGSRRRTGAGRDRGRLGGDRELVARGRVDSGGRLRTVTCPTHPAAEPGTPGSGPRPLRWPGA